MTHLKHYFKLYFAGKYHFKVSDKSTSFSAECVHCHQWSHQNVVSWHATGVFTYAREHDSPLVWFFSFNSGLGNVCWTLINCLCQYGYLVMFKIICDALRDLVSFVQFKKCEKLPWRSVNVSKVAGFHVYSLQLY